ncbi:MAG: hypothetical protein U1E87_10240 [Alphaproteobacteria bacterium]
MVRFIWVLGALAAINLTVALAETAGERRLAKPEHYDLALTVDFDAGTIAGSAAIRLANPHDRPLADVSFLLYRLMSVKAVRDQAGNAVSFTQEVAAFEDEPTWQINHIVVHLAQPLASGERTTLKLDYEGHLLGYAETGALYIQDRVDPAYSIIREDALAYPVPRTASFAINRAAGFPAFDYRASITVPKSHVVANSGKLVTRTVRGGAATYVYESLKPSWRMDFAVAPFGMIERGRLRVFHLPEDAQGAELLVQAMERCFALYAHWFGELKGSSRFTVIELPEGWGSQSDVTGILQEAPAFRNPDNFYEAYHEISHLWNVPSLDAAPPRIEEGLAMFLAYLAAERLDKQKPIADRAVARLERARKQIAGNDKLRTVPMADYGRQQMTDYSYGIGQLMFHLLHAAMGEDRFNAALARLYRDYRRSGATTQDFVRMFEENGPPGVGRIFDDWLRTTKWTELVSSGQSFDQISARYGVPKAAN